MAESGPGRRPQSWRACSGGASEPRQLGGRPREVSPLGNSPRVGRLLTAEANRPASPRVPDHCRPEAQFGADPSPAAFLLTDTADGTRRWSRASGAVGARREHLDCAIPLLAPHGLVARPLAALPRAATRRPATPRDLHPLRREDVGCRRSEMVLHDRQHPVARPAPTVPALRHRCCGGRMMPQPLLVVRRGHPQPVDTLRASFAKVPDVAVGRDRRVGGAARRPAGGGPNAAAVPIDAARRPPPGRSWTSG